MSDRRLKLGFKGFIAKIEVINHRGETVWRDNSPRKNLLLDQGLDQMAATHIADLFLFAIKGTGTSVTTEVPANTNTYSQGAGTTTITRAAGTRDFTSGDIGKLIKFTGSTGKEEAKILSITSTTQVEVDRTQAGAITAKTITIYSVQQTGLDTETNMRNITGTCTKALSSGAVSCDTAAQFTAADVGKVIYFPTVGAAYPITAFTDGQHITVDNSVDDQDITGQPAIIYVPRTNEQTTSQGRTDTYSVVPGDNSTSDGTGANLGVRTMQRTYIFDPELPNEEDVTGTYTRSSGTVTRTAGARDFSANDVGKVLAFSDGTEYTITVFTDATHVTVTPTTGPTSSTNIKLYGFTSYTEVGFSHLGFPGNNANIRVLLANAANVQAPTGQNPGQQLKLTYVFIAALTPNASTASNPTVNDSGNQMSGSKAGNIVVETLGITSVSTDGSTDTTFTGLEPSEGGSMGISPSAAALVPLNGPDRSNGIVVQSLTPDGYSSGTFTNFYRGTFGLNDAIGSAWRSLLIYDPASTQALLTHLFNVVQHKDANHVLNVVWQKTWNRNLN